jgi:hypothetical protein
LELQLPSGRGQIIRALDIPIGLDADIYRLKAQSHDSSDTSAYWNQPNVPLGAFQLAVMIGWSVM